MNKLKLDLTLILSGIDEQDRCIQLLTDRLAVTKGIEQAHIVRDKGRAQLCLHYDPNLLSLSKIRWLAQETGTQITGRYRHEQIPFGRMDTADAAVTLSQFLEKLPGMLHANANYAAGLVFVAYDSQVLTRPAIEQAIRSMGFKVLVPTLAEPEPVTTQEHAQEDHAGHDHDRAPTFLPHWTQERWPLILVTFAGLFLVIGWAGERWFGLPANLALSFLLLA